MTSSAWTSERIVAARPAKHAVDLSRPYAYFVEAERQRDGQLEDVAVLMLTGRECVFRCLMCDLWKHTIDGPTPPGAIPTQIRFGLDHLPPATQIKLYNGSNFFDPHAVPVVDHEAIISLASGMNRVIVENHPRLCGPRIAPFRDSLRDRSGAMLEIAMGLETVHPGVLRLLNKGMTTDDFRRACDFLVSMEVAIRAFVLLRPPTMDEAQGIEWAIRSIEFAFDCGVGVVSVIPTRAGNGAMESLQQSGDFEHPAWRSLEKAQVAGIAMNRGRVFVDLWDSESESLTDDEHASVASMRRMNAEQRIV